MSFNYLIEGNDRPSAYHSKYDEYIEKRKHDMAFRMKLLSLKGDEFKRLVDEYYKGEFENKKKEK